MRRWLRLLSAIGGLFVVLAVNQASLVLREGGPVVTLLVEFVLVAGAGVTLLYVSYWVPRTEINADLYPRIAGWCLSGVGMMTTVVVLLLTNPAGSVNQPIRASSLGAALGSVVGLSIGLNEGRAITHARKAERASLRADLAERRSRQLDEFAVVVSHDLRGPLRMVSSSLTFLQQRYEDDFDEEAREFLDFAVEGAEQIDTLIDDLLALARAEGVVEPTPLELTDVVDDAWTAVETADATLEVTVDEFVILAERERLQQLLTHLFRNAVVHGGPEVSVRVGHLPDGFFVADDGPGIAAETPEQAFELGYTTADERSGFGLSIVERIAAAHGWDVQFVDPNASGARCEISDVERPTSLLAATIPGVGGDEGP